jgi:hypothetical protein
MNGQLRAPGEDGIGALAPHGWRVLRSPAQIVLSRPLEAVARVPEALSA